MRFTKASSPLPLLTLALVAVLLAACSGDKKAASAASAAADTTVDTVAAPVFDTAADPVSQSLLDEVNERLRYKDQPIHPFGVRALLEGEDEYPGPVALDLEGVNGSRHYAGRVSTAGGGIRADNPPPADYDVGLDGEANYGYFTYRRVGTLTNGWHVLRTGDNGGGTSIFETLLFVRFRVDEEYGDGVRRRVLIERRGMISLGDRYQGQIRVFGDSIFIAADVASGYRTEDQTFGFPALD